MLGKIIQEQRLKKGYSKTKLADLVGVTGTAIGQYEKGENNPKTEVLLLLSKELEYDFITDQPLIVEKTPVFATLQKTEAKLDTPVTEIIPTKNDDSKGVPYYDVDFLGGFDLVYNDQSIKPAFFIDFLPFNDCDAWINVSGKSMGPLIAHGDIVALKYQQNWKRFLLEGEIYAVVTDNGFRTIKQLGAGPDRDHFMLIPYNKDDIYKPQPIPKEVITHIFRVKGNIKRFF